MGEYLSIDETSLSDGELYTILSNKAAKGRKGSIVGIIKGTSAEIVTDHILKIKTSLRRKVKEVTLDMAGNMELIVGRCFPQAAMVTDRFHVEKLVAEALQHMRIEHRWEAIEQENKEIELCKEHGVTYKAHVLENGDTHKQLLARSRYLLFKSESKWTNSQVQRSEILFKYYPDLLEGYKLIMQLKGIYQNTRDKILALTRLAKWYEAVEQSKFKTFGTAKRSIAAHYKNIVNFFDRRSTNASAESLNAKIKSFRAILRGVKNIPYFLFRLTNIYA